MSDISATVTSQPISAAVASSGVSATVTSSSSSVSTSGGVGPQGPAGVSNVPGPAGAVGPAGPVGAAGPQGIPGVAGARGEVGATGPQGIPGVAGAAGPAGVAGAKGDRGDVGPQGIPGVAGAKGDTGERGATGPAGEAGTQGIQGVAGPAGAVGATGLQGIQGPPGVAGQKGDTGERGPQGIQGIQGVAGATGSVGPQGPAGATGATGPQASLVYSSITDFPATGSASALYLDESTSRLYQWESPFYVEIGVSGGGGSIIDGNKGDITVSGNGAAWAINPSAVVTADIADSAVTDAKIAGVAATKLTGTLEDARLSANVILASALAATTNQATDFIEPIDRLALTTAQGLVNTAQYWTFFTPAYSLTITQIAYASAGSVASGLTLCRFGLYTMTAAGSGTLVARTANDTTCFNAGNTIFTRDLDATGGYVSSYTLQAGQRYAVSVAVAGTGNMGSLFGSACPNALAGLTPRVQGVRTGVTDLVTNQGSGQYSGAVGHIYWARLS